MPLHELRQRLWVSTASPPVREEAKNFTKIVDLGLTGRRGANRLRNSGASGKFQRQRQFDWLEGIPSGNNGWGYHS